MPPARKVPAGAPPKLAGAIPFIEAILAGDRKAPRKQRHTAHWIWQRVRRELSGVIVGESTVREYVRQRKVALGLARQEILALYSYEAGGEAQVDWYEAWAELDGELRKVFIFCLRSMASGGAYHRAYLRANQQAFLKDTSWRLRISAGSFRVLRYDNLTSAVKKILRGHQREETTRFIAFRSHWGFGRSFVMRARDTRRVAWKEKWASSAATIWCWCRKCVTLRS